MFNTVTPTALDRRTPNRSMNATLIPKKPIPPGVVRPVNAAASCTAVVRQNGNGVELEPMIEMLLNAIATNPVSVARASQPQSALQSESITALMLDSCGRSA
jgi:hypothetical protein